MQDQRRGMRSRRLPRNQQRERVMRLVGEADSPVDASEIADQMGLHITTVRFHLDALCEDGSVARTRIKRDGVGRPRTGYVAVRDRLDYRSLAEVLAMELGDTVAERRERAERAGRRWAERILSNDDDPDEPGAHGGTEDAADQIAGIFERMGFGPELIENTDGDGPTQCTIRLYACPVRDLARTHPEVSCGMHLGLLRGLLNGSGADATLEPFAEPEMCIARFAGN